MKTHSLRSESPRPSTYQRAVRYANTHEKDDIHTPWSAMVQGYEAGLKAGKRDKKTA